MDAVTCSKCGGPISPTESEVGRGFVTCAYCNSTMMLEAKRPDKNGKAKETFDSIEKLERPVAGPVKGMMPIENEPGVRFLATDPVSALAFVVLLLFSLMLLLPVIGMVLGAAAAWRDGAWWISLIIVIPAIILGWLSTLPLRFLYDTFTRIEIKEGMFEIERLYLFIKLIKRYPLTQVKGVAWRESPDQGKKKTKEFQAYLLVEQEDVRLFGGSPPSENYRLVYQELKKFFSTR